jgi:predicted hotdog family 3-hydroxylacyl-ACP dehydratase
MTRQNIAVLVPQQEAMCLLDEILHFDERSIVCGASSHRSSANPLRCDGRLPACAAIEYGAQAMAAHGALRTSPAVQVQAGLLAGARGLRLSVRFLDDEPGLLKVRAERLIEDGGRLLYAFAVEGAGRQLAAGRLAVVLRPVAAP